MNSENANFEPSEEIVKIGETLKRARESASFSIEHVVSHTHLSTDVIQALEEERFDQLQVRYLFEVTCEPIANCWKLMANR